MAFGSMNSGDDSPMSDINVTPLVDVMLVLLIVFMITILGADAFHPFGTADRVRADKQAGQTA